MQVLVSCVQTGTTALFFAAQGGFLDIAQILLDRRAPVDAPSEVGRYADGTGVGLDCGVIPANTHTRT
jgi:hypothetical protein